MANCSSAVVEISVDKVGKEFLEYVKTVGDPEYHIISDDLSSVEADENNNLYVEGWATGRWSYSNNLEGYFEPSRVAQWLGVGADYSWVEEQEKRDQYARESLESYIAYKKLSEAMVERDGKITIAYTDEEGGNGFISKGIATIQAVGGELTLTDDSETYDYNVVNGMEYLGYDTLEEAIEILHGDEALTAYKEARPEDQRSAEDFDEWYENWER